MKCIKRGCTEASNWKELNVGAAGTETFVSGPGGRRLSVAYRSLSSRNDGLDRGGMEIGEKVPEQRIERRALLMSGGWIRVIGAIADNGGDVAGGRGGGVRVQVPKKGIIGGCTLRVKQPEVMG